MIEKAIKRVCTCSDSDNKIIYLDTLEVDHELLSLSMFYCEKCKSYWMEP